MPPNPKINQRIRMSSSPPSAEPSQNPNNWRFRWEAQSHIPTVRLCLFNPNIEPSTQCADLKVNLLIEQSLLLVSFTQAEAETSLRVPLPRVLIDHESPVRFRAHDDHIEIKLVLLLSVDHPLVSEFDSTGDEFQPLSMDSDLKKLSALEEVCFYCRSCSTKLTRPLRFFKEMPSTNWQDVADNWFGDCCCSFGGISEKLVTKYVKSYACDEGICLLDMTSVILCKDDLVGCESLKWRESQNNKFPINLADENFAPQATLANGIKQDQTACFVIGCDSRQNFDGKKSLPCCKEDNLKVKLNHEDTERVIDNASLSCIASQLQVAEDMAAFPDIYTDAKHGLGNCDTGCCSLEQSEGSSKEKKSEMSIELLAHQKILLNGFLSNGFMARSSNLSKDVRWIEFSCPQCSCLLGAYPCFNDQSLLDGGVRLFKCYISTCFPVVESNDFFRSHSLERMFAIQLLESAKDELSFRTVVRDMQTNHPMIHLVLLNPDSWSYTGCLYHTESDARRINLYPTIKVLVSLFSNEEIVLRNLDEWINKNEVDEVYMLPSLIKELITCLESVNVTYPLSQMSLQGLLLSSLRR